MHIEFNSLVVATAFLCLGLSSCAKTEAFVINTASELKKTISGFHEQDITIDSYKKENDQFLFCFSNGIDIRLKNNLISIATIDIRGFWCIGGEKTTESLDVPGETILFSSEDDHEIIVIVEGFTDWSFYFEKDDRIIIGKSLFSTNPDVVIRGINHRGYCLEAPENTLPAFRLSKLMGFRYVETDVRFTSDNIPVLIHDSTIDRTSNGSGLVNNLSWTDLQQFDFGSWKSKDYSQTQIPSLEEFLSLCRDIDLCPYIELKEGSIEQITIITDLVEKYGFKDQAVYISFSTKLLKSVINNSSSAIVGVLVNHPLEERSIKEALGLKTGMGSVFIDSADFSEEALSLCQKASLPLEVWTIDDVLAIKNLPSYISGVTSNVHHAGRLLSVKQ